MYTYTGVSKIPSMPVSCCDNVAWKGIYCSSPIVEIILLTQLDSDALVSKGGSLRTRYLKD